MNVVGRHNGLNIGEIRVLDWLAESFAGLSGVILVEPSYKHQKDPDKWPDFIIVSPTHGICILECKAHGSEEIKQIDNVQELETVDGLVKYRRQLVGYHGLVQDLLKEQALPISKVAIFPYILASEPVAQALVEFNSKASGISLLFRETMALPASPETFFGPALSKKLRAAELELVLSLLNPMRVFKHNYLEDIETLHKTIQAFDAAQLRFIDHIHEGEHYMINGLPGTGKTRMLIAVAERELEQGKKVLYTCFNEPLKEAVAKELGSDVARTTSSLYYAEVRELFDWRTDPQWRQKAIPILLEKEISPEYDVLLIDEYQDLEAEDYAILLKFLKPEGTLVLAGDRLQNIMGSKETWKSRGIKLHSSRSMFLSVPYRTQPAVVDFALKFVCSNEALAETARRYFKDHDFEHSFGSFKELPEKVKFVLGTEQQARHEIGRMLEENPRAEILVVVNHKGQAEKLRFAREARLRVEPYSRVKGLEADVVVLYNVDFYKECFSASKTEEKMKSLFSALCRSRGSVFIHGFQSKDFYFELKELYLDCLAAEEDAS